MFDWFKKNKDSGNVVPFPEPRQVPPMPEVQPPAEKPAQTYYRLGITDNNRVSFQMGYSEITMNVAGVNMMIRQLETFRDLLEKEE